MKEKIIAHESISLKEEKRLLQDIKELKAQKKQLSSNMGSKAEMGEAFEQKEHIHEQQKVLYETLYCYYYSFSLFLTLVLYFFSHLDSEEGL